MKPVKVVGDRVPAQTWAGLGIWQTCPENLSCVPASLCDRALQVFTVTHSADAALRWRGLAPHGSSRKAEPALSCEALDIVSGDLCHALSKLTFISSDIWPSTRHILIQQFWHRYRALHECSGEELQRPRTDGQGSERVVVGPPSTSFYLGWHVWIDWWHRNCLRSHFKKSYY